MYYRICGFLVLLTIIFYCGTTTRVTAQSNNEKRIEGERNLLLEFYTDYDRMKDVFMHYYIPINDSIIAYQQDGTPVNIYTEDTLFITSVAIGEFGNFSGKWLVQHINHNYLYIPFSPNLKDITVQVRAHFRAQRDIRISNKLLYVLILSLPFLGIGLYVKILRPSDVSLPPGLQKNKK